jgi:hypothetical protein
MGAWKLARQKWLLEHVAHVELRGVRMMRASMSVVEAAERKASFAEDETENAISLLFDEYRSARDADDASANDNLRSA